MAATVQSRMCSYLRTVLLLACLAGSSWSDDYTCPAANVFGIDCDQGFGLLMDVTNLMSKDRVTDMFQFMRNHLLPQVYYSRDPMSLNTYGASSPQMDFSDNYAAQCKHLNALNNDAIINGGNPANLTAVIKREFEMYNFTVPAQITILTDTQDEYDIVSAATYITNYRYESEVSIVALSGNADIWKRKNRHKAFKNVIPIVTSFVSMSKMKQNALAKCILCISCASEICFYDCLEFTSSSPPSTRVPPVTFPPPVTVPPSAPSTEDGPVCSCNLNSLWIDVIVLIDNSAATGQDGLNNLLAYVKSTFANVNIQKSTSSQQTYTRMGIMTYNLQSSDVYSVGSMDSSNLRSITQLPYSSWNATNIDNAINSALQELAFNGRPNARQVILIAAKDYYSSPSYDDPLVRASQFKNKGGIIAVYNYLDGKRVASPTLQDLASPGYYSRSTDYPAFNMPHALCNANCFCPSGYVPYKSDALNAAPTAGCYQAVRNAITFVKAGQTCQILHDNGYVAMEKNIGKAVFLSSLMQPTDKYWAVFKWDSITGEWVWNDGQKVVGPYQPWVMSSAHSQGVDCAFVQQVGGVWMWTQEVCGASPGHTFVCEQPACDSTHYCTDSR